MRNLRRLPLILTITCFLTRSLFSQNSELAERAAAGLKNTIIAASLEQKLKAGQNVVYCATIQLAWNELIETFTKEPIQIAGNPAIVHDLNQQLIRKQDFSEDCYMTMADFGKNDVLERIRKKMREKFNTDPHIDFKISPNTIFVFAYLQKSLPFRYQFNKLEYPVYFNQKSTVEAFGLDELEIGFRESLLAPEKEESEISDESENITELTSDNVENHDWRNADQKKADQVYILDYKNNDDFIIRLKTNEIREELILAKIPPQKTLLETYTHVRQRIANLKKITFLQERETLQIPIIDIKAVHQFAELGNQRILNKNLSNMLIGQASQTIQFRLDETGATAIFMEKMVVEGISRNIPRHLIFDSPFLLYLKEKKANYPYLIIWFENSELLVEKPIENFKIKQAVFEELFDLNDY